MPHPKATLPPYIHRFIACLLAHTPCVLLLQERDDPLDALSRKGGVLGALGNFMGGKAGLESQLNEAGFVETYTLAE